MGPRRFMWSLSLPLAAAAWYIAHSLAYLLVEPRSQHRDQLLAETGHSDFLDAPVVAACALTLMLAGFALAVHDGIRDRGRERIPVRPLAVLPPAGFAVQEHLERLVATGTFPVDAALEPTFAVGLALQLPIAAMTVVVARAVLGFGHALGRRVTVGHTVRLPAWAGPPHLAPPSDSLLVRWPARAGRHGQRAPPRSVVV